MLCELTRVHSRPHVPRSLVSRAKAPLVKRNEKDYGDETDTRNHVLEVGITIIINSKVHFNLLLSLFIDRSGNPLEENTGF